MNKLCHCVFVCIMYVAFGTMPIAAAPGNENSSAANRNFQAESPPSPEPPRVQLTSDFFATPLKIPRDPQRRLTTSVQLDVSFAGSSGGTGTITLDDSPLEFNAFGDARRLVAADATPVQIKLRAPQLANDSERGRCAYEIAFSDGRFAQQMLVVRWLTPSPRYQLLIRASRADDVAREPDRIDWSRAAGRFRYDFELAYLIELYDRSGPAAPPLAKVLAIRDTVGFLSGFVAQPAGQIGRMRHVRFSVSGPLGGAGYFLHDRNRVRFNVFGDGMPTAMAYMPEKVTLRPINLADPAGSGRRLYAIQHGHHIGQAPWNPNIGSYARMLVVAPAGAGPHRLVISGHKQPAQVLRLHDPEAHRF